MLSKIMIVSVHVKNFRGIADETIGLGRLTVLVGRNGAGKSSVVDVIRFVRDALTIGLDDALVARHGIVALRRYAPKPFDVEIDITLETKSWKGLYSFCVASGKEGEYRVKREFCQASAGDQPPQWFIRDGSEIELSKTLSPSAGRHRLVEPTSLTLPSVAIFSPVFSRIRGYLRGVNFCAIFPILCVSLRSPRPQSN